MDQGEANFGVRIGDEPRKLASRLSGIQARERIQTGASPARPLARKLIAQPSHGSLPRQQALQRAKCRHAHERVPVLQSREDQIGDLLLVHGAQRVRGRASDIGRPIVAEQCSERVHLAYSRGARRGFPDANVGVFEQRPGRSLGQARRELTDREPH